MATTPRELSDQSGIPERRIRKILRTKYRPNGENKHARWVLDDDMVRHVLGEARR